jgi:hypothetical protein
MKKIFLLSIMVFGLFVANAIGSGKLERVGFHRFSAK